MLNIHYEMEPLDLKLCIDGSFYEFQRTEATDLNWVSDANLGSAVEPVVLAFNGA